MTSLDAVRKLVEAAGVVAQDVGLVSVAEVGALEDLVHLFAAVGEADLVREVRREHERAGADALDSGGQGAFVAFAADEDAAVGEVIDNRALDREPAVLELPL